MRKKKWLLFGHPGSVAGLLSQGIAGGGGGGQCKDARGLGRDQKSDLASSRETSILVTILNQLNQAYKHALDKGELRRGRGTRLCS